jgi:inner membrane protein involved in colicin E2 resistance
MVKRIAAILFIFVCTGIAWAVLGATIFSRTYSSDDRLKGQVVSTWGAPHQQQPPRAFWKTIVPRQVEVSEGGRKTVRLVEDEVQTHLPLEKSRIEAALDLEHRQKGLLWYSTYKVAFAGDYEFRNPADKEQQVTFEMEFPAEQAIYDDLVFQVDGEAVAVETAGRTVRGVRRVPAGAAARLHVGYRSQGLDSWRYTFGANVAQVRDFRLKLLTNFKDIDFPENTLSPSAKRETAGGWELEWGYTNLVSGFQIGMVMPEKLQPGPLAGRISLFAPVSLWFFFFLMFIITVLRGIELHPMNYLFLACAFFSFHLLMAYLVDHISIHAAFVICSAVSITLVVSYLRLVVGLRFAAVEAGLAQLIYLVLFSYAFFFRGITGLAITIGSILTLFAVMQMTGRIRWAEKFASGPGQEPARTGS